MDNNMIDVSVFEPRPSFTEGTPYSFLDADTIKNDEGELFRVQGLSMPEIMHITKDGLTPGGPGGYEATQQIDKLAKEMGFNNVHRLTNPDGSPMMDATGTRQLVRISDENGRDFVQSLSSYGINRLGSYSSQEEIDAYNWGKAKNYITPFEDDKPLNNFEKAKLAIDSAVESETYNASKFKEVALDEQQLARLNAPRQPGESIEQYAVRLQRAKDYTNVRVLARHNDRTLKNKALHPWSESWDVGWTGVIEGLYGAAEMIGERTGFNWLEALGDKGIKRQHEYLKNKPEIKMNILKPVLDADGNVIDNEWDTGGVSGFFEYIGNMGAMAMPYMGVTAGATLAAPITGGTSLAVPVAMYTGQTWNDMEGDNKSATLAAAAGITMTVLDKLGIVGLMGGTKGISILSKDSREKMVNAWVKKYKKGDMSADNKALARNAIEKMTRLESAKLVKHAAEIAKDQLQYGNILKSFAARSAQGFGVESTTEVGQELTGYMASVIGSDKHFDSVELHNRLINAFIAGGTLGAGFGVPGTIYDVGQWTDVAVRTGVAEDKRLSQEGKYAEEEARRGNEYATDDKGNILKDAYGQQIIKKRGSPRSVDDIAIAAAKRAKNRIFAPSDTDFLQKAEAHDATQKTKDTWTKVKEAAANFPMLYQGSMRFLISPYTNNQSVRDIGALVNGFLHKINPGESLEEYKQLQAATFRKMIKSPAMLSKNAKFKRINQLELSKITNAFGEWAKDRDLTKLDWNTLPDGSAVEGDANFTGGVDLKKHKDWLAEFTKEINALGDALYNQQREARLRMNDGSKTDKTFDVPYLKNYMTRYKSINKAAIERNKNGFIKMLMKSEFSDGTEGFGSYTGPNGKRIKQGFTLDDATNLANQILNNGDMLDERSVFEVGRGRFIPASHKNRTLNLSENKDFNEFMEQDVFVNINNAIKSATRYMAYQKYVGDNNEILNQMLEDAMANGLAEKDANYLAAGLRDYLQAESGNYKRIENQTINSIQKNILVWTTLAGLPMATISSMVEYMMTLRALTPAQIATTIKASAKEFAQAAWDTITNPGLQNIEARKRKEERQAKLQKLGFFDWDVGAAQTTGATENTYASRYLLDKYFRIIGLQQWTDYTRNIRAAIADDFIMDHLNTINTQRTTNGLYSNEVQEAEEQLRNLGLDVNKLLALANQTLGLPLFDRVRPPLADTMLTMRETDQELERMFSLAEYNFINEAIALPGTANRPLFYQNPHLALFTQFQGFIATFTANQIPRMWGDYVKRGTPAMKYNAFAIMCTMIALGFVSQYLKDLLKYGKATPYLDKGEVIQRGVGASGLIGVAERPLNFFFPIYETSSSNMVEELFQTVSGEAAALSNVTRAATGVGQLIEGNIEPGAYKVLKTTPLTGPFNQLNRAAASGINELFGG